MYNLFVHTIYTLNSILDRQTNTHTAICDYRKHYKEPLREKSSEEKPNEIAPSSDQFKGKNESMRNNFLEHKSLSLSNDKLATISLRFEWGVS
jgi:hypothetical protein